MVKNHAEDGTFFVRDRTEQPGEYILVLQFKNKSTHHLLKHDQDGIWTVNTKVIANARTIAEVI